MAEGYLYSQEFWFHVLFLSAFMLPLIVLVIVTVAEAIVKRLTRRALDAAQVCAGAGYCEIHKVWHMGVSEETPRQ